MSSELLIKCVASIVFSLMFAWAVYTRYNSKPVQADEERCACRPVIHGALLPVFLAAAARIYTIAGFIIYTNMCRFVLTSQYTISSVMPYPAPRRHCCRHFPTSYFDLHCGIS